MTAKESIEPPYALEAGRERDLSQGKLCFGDQALGQEQAIGLNQFDRRNTQFFSNRPAQLPRANAKASGQVFQATAIVERAGFDTDRCSAGECARAIDWRMARSKFWAATKAGSKAGLFGQCTTREEPAVLAKRRLDGADGSAVDTRRLHANEEEPVEADIMGSKGTITGVVVEDHALNGSRDPPTDWPFSDMRIGLAARPGDRFLPELAGRLDQPAGRDLDSLQGHTELFGVG